MTPSDLRDSLDQAEPPAGLSMPQRALWLDAKGDWEGAHKIVQADDSQAGAWVHAYLHRVEGDLSNARYWYGRAGKDAAEESLEAEWREIAQALSDPS